MSTDAIVMLKEDHKQVKQLFRQIDKLKDGGAELLEAVNEVCQQLTIHAALEEELFYPLVRQTLKDDDMVLEAGEEHHIVTVLINELDALSSDDEHYFAKATVLKELVLHHIEEEESEMFPMLREKLGRRELTEIGEAMLARKEELMAEVPEREMAGSAANQSR